MALARQLNVIDSTARNENEQNLAITIQTVLASSLPSSRKPDTAGVF
jgi:hypothetical protein